VLLLNFTHQKKLHLKLAPLRSVFENIGSLASTQEIFAKLAYASVKLVQYRSVLLRFVFISIAQIKEVSLNILQCKLAQTRFAY